MPYAAINGIEFYYEVHGQGAPVVFAHGPGATTQSGTSKCPSSRATTR